MADQPIADKLDNDFKQERNNKALKFLYWLLFIGVLAMIIYSIKELWYHGTDHKLDENRVTNMIFYFSLCVLLGGSCLTAGCLTGFIFAIPKSVSDSTQNLIKSPKGGVVSNDNLAQVSDWLTKIIVGVGLTSIRRIPHYVQSVSEYIGQSLGNGIDNYGTLAAGSIIVYFLVCGFLLAYLWTRIYFEKMLE